ncbi:MAG: hypothetical protein AAB461_00925 [Patescibacteria group bacterium]
MKIFSKKIFPIIIFLGLFLPVFDAQAGDWFGLGSIAYSVAANMFAYVGYIMFSLVGKFMAVAVDLLYWSVNIRIYTNIPVIQESWKIMRDFANMLFIIALVIMAYGTIFNISGYDFRSLIAKFLIAALLINFSLVIGGLIIDGTQILNNTFLNAMGDISAKLGQGMEPWKLLPTETQDNGEGFTSLVASSFATIIFALFLAITFLISVSVPLVMAFVRIPILWALLIVSPMAWLSSILPATRSVYDRWWKEFLAWTLFLPYYLFFLYFALYFLSKKNEVIAGLGQTFVKDTVTGLTGLQSEFTFGLIFYYSLIAVFLIGGTKVAMNAGRFSGTKVISVAKWGRGQTMRYLGVTAAQRGALQKLEEVKKEGLPGRASILYGGEYGLEQQTGRWAQRFGVRGAELKNQKAFVDLAGKNFADFEREYQNGKISEDDVVNRARQFNATDPRGYAYRKLTAKIGQMDNDLFTSTLEQLSNNPLAGEDFAKTAAGAKFSKMKGSDLAKMAAAEGPYSFLENNVAARREMFKYVLTDKRAMSGLEDSQIEAGISVFGGHTTTEGKNFLKEVGKVNPNFVIKYKLDSKRNPDLADKAKDEFNDAYSITRGTQVGDFELKTHLFGGYLRSGDIKDIAGIKKDIFETPEFQEALKIYISQFSTEKTRKGFVERLERAFLDTPEGDQKLDLVIGIPATPTTPAIQNILGLDYFNIARHPKRLLRPPTAASGPLG